MTTTTVRLTPTTYKSGSLFVPAVIHSAKYEDGSRTRWTERVTNIGRYSTRVEAMTAAVRYVEFLEASATAVTR